MVIGSSEFVNDNVYQISLNFGGDRFASNLQLVANAIDYFTQDLSLASIRSRGSIARILPPHIGSRAESVDDFELCRCLDRFGADRHCLAGGAPQRRTDCSHPASL